MERSQQSLQFPLSAHYAKRNVSRNEFMMLDAQRGCLLNTFRLALVVVAACGCPWWRASWLLGESGWGGMLTGVSYIFVISPNHHVITSSYHPSISTTLHHHPWGGDSGTPRQEGGAKQTLERLAARAGEETPKNQMGPRPRQPRGVPNQPDTAGSNKQNQKPARQPRPSPLAK